MSLKPLNRRHFLGGAGAAVALPLLEAMLPVGKSAFAASAKPTRIMAYFLPNGIHMPSWTPSGEGNNYTLSKTLAPLTPYKNDMLVLTGLANRPGEQAIGGHAPGTGSFLTATKITRTAGADIKNGISVDQVAAQRLGHLTRFPSLVLGMDGGGSSGACDSGYSCVYERNISWSGPQTPVAKTTSPLQLFNRMFGGFDSGETAKQQAFRLKMNASVMDYIQDDVKRLEKKLGSTDKAKLDEYFTGVNELERKVTAPEVNANCPTPKAPAENTDVPTKVKVMTDLMTLAFQCDLTRVQTFMIANGFSFNIYPFLNIAEDHHLLSHHQNNPDNFAKLEIINKWMVEQFAYLLQKLKATKDVDGTTLLDSSLVFLSSEISDGDRHNKDNMPVVLAGRGNGYVNPGRHVIYRQERPFANLYMSMLDAFGASVQKFGDNGTGLLESLRP